MMLYILLILFFGSLAGIAFMTGKKLMMLQNKEIPRPNNEEFFFNPHFEDFKHTITANTKKQGYILLVITIRIYFRVTNSLKTKWQEMKKNLGEIYRRRQNKIRQEKREVNSFLRMISEYKNKIGKIKEKIKKEENLQ